MGHFSLPPASRMAVARVGIEDRTLVLDEPSAATGEGLRTTGEPCPLLLAVAGGEPSDATAVKAMVQQTADLPI